MSTNREVKRNPKKDPSEWTTGDEPMTGPQASYLKTLCQEAKTEFDENLTKAEASKKIDELQRKTGRARSQDSGQRGASGEDVPKTRERS